MPASCTSRAASRSSPIKRVQALVDAAVGLASFSAALLIALIGATWRIGNKVGGVSQQLDDHAGRLSRLEHNQDAHDRWHVSRGIT